MENKTFSKARQQKLRTARLSVATAIQDVLSVGEILKKFVEIFDTYHQKYLLQLKNRKIDNSDEIIIKLSGCELAEINEALRDFITLRIANIVDSDPSTRSLKDFPSLNLGAIRKIPQIKAILDARDNWIGHINKRFIGPVDKEILYSEEVINLLRWIEMLVCTGSIKEQQKSKMIQNSLKKENK